MPTRTKSGASKASAASKAKPSATATKATKTAKTSKAAGKPSAAKSQTAASKKRKAGADADDATESESDAGARIPKKAKIEAAPQKPKAPPKAAPKKPVAAPEKPAAAPKKPTPAPKKAATAAKKTETKKPETKTKTVSIPIGKKINTAPTVVLDVYVFGEGTSGELGLGSKRVGGKKPIDVKRPRLNENLSAEHVGVVQIACGGMHAVALTRDNKILTWGVNDQGALGRDTAWEGNLRDADADSSDSDDDDTGLNPRESTPAALSADHFAPGTKFVQVVASDSATFALTEDGRVYGWGTFRSSDGILGFTEGIRVQTTPMLLPSLKGIKTLAAGSNHILALDHKGIVVAWGCGQQFQLGRRIIERNKLSSLAPQGVGLPRGKIVKIACGSYHSLAIDGDGRVWGWGLNNFGEIQAEDNVGDDDAVILKPAKITTLEDYIITNVDGGVHHSLACSDKGDLLTWGRVDGYQVGFDPAKLDKDSVIFDERGCPRILTKPTKHDGVSDVASVAAGTDNSFAVTRDGKVYSWGFSANYQTGQGVIDDVQTPTLIDNSTIRDKKVLAAHAGGQFSVLVGEADGGPKTNGVNGH